MKTILVTGAAGFLGRYFVREHLRLGDYVIGIDDLSSSGSHWPDELPVPQRYEVDAGLFFAADAGGRHFDIAYHFAAPVGGRVKIEGDPLFNADSLRLDSLFFRWAVRRTRLAVYPSSSAVYGVNRQGDDARALAEGLFEPSFSVWDTPDEMYGFTKLAGEVLAWKSAAYGLNVLCLRPFSGYGAGQSLEYPVPAICQRAKERQDPLIIWGSGMQTRDFVHVTDIVAATLARIEAGVSGYARMNIGSGRPISFPMVAEVASRIVGYSPHIRLDSSKPEGVRNRYADTTEMGRYHLAKVSLLDGLRDVLDSLGDEDATA